MASVQSASDQVGILFFARKASVSYMCSIERYTLFVKCNHVADSRRKNMGEVEQKKRKEILAWYEDLKTQYLKRKTLFLLMMGKHVGKLMGV